ncbi:hypothetical protein [Youngiibacter multivorans]|uniref:Uncharacterized protein n=1 Tax=Youngiibacter multivorans TaxID=937251 RepID=A0ABS4G728_9CLOT|nr:hypothetical protein [Youngiibacter multivorans]MBP1920075.1 hypothetical protein [Youngiibacter multivorans]
MSIEILKSAVRILERLGILDRMVLAGEPAACLCRTDMDFEGIFTEIPFLIEKPHSMPKADIHEAFRAEGFDYLEDCYGRLSTFHKDETRVAFYTGLNGSSRARVLEVPSLGLNIMAARKYNQAFESTLEICLDGLRIRITGAVAAEHQ